MRILAIDPGPLMSAYVVLTDGKPEKAETVTNEFLRNQLAFLEQCQIYGAIAIEMIACFGMPAGRELFETCLWIGRFMERSPIEPRLVYRKDVKMHFCQSMRAKDANIRQALIDRFGGKEAAIGKKKTPGPLYGIKSHIWSALAIAVFAADTA